MEYIGEVIPNQEFIRRTKEYEASGLEHYYFMTLKTDEVSLNVCNSLQRKSNVTSDLDY